MKRKGKSKTSQRYLPIQTRAATVSSVDVENRTAIVCFTTGARVTRWDVDEELEVSKKAMRMERANSGSMALLNSHDQYSLSAVLGVVERAWLKNGEGMAEIRFSKREDVEPIFQDVADGIIKSISVGYRVFSYDVKKTEGERDLYTARDWEPHEISLVAVPADAGSSIRSANADDGSINGAASVDGSHFTEGRFSNCLFFDRSQDEMNLTELLALQARQQAGETLTAAEMTALQAGQAELARHAEQNEPATPTAAPTATPTAEPATAQRSDVQAAAAQAAESAIAAERVRASTIAGNVRRLGLDPALGEELVSRGVSVADANAALVERMAARDAVGGTERSQGRVQTVGDAPSEVMSRGIQEAIAHRVNPGAELSDNGRQYRGMSMMRMAEEMLSANGVQVGGLSRMEVATRAFHSTSDFPILLGNVARQRLGAEYEEVSPTYTQWARRGSNFPDFKEVSVAQLSQAPGLLKVPESGEFKYGTMEEAGMKYALATYGRVIGFTRQMLINDDLGAFDRIIPAFAHQARNLENQLVYNQILSNPVMNDGTTLFHADHKNLLAAGSAMSKDAFSKMRSLIRKQTGLKNERLNLTPAYVLAPTTLEQKVYELTSANYVPAKQEDINEFRAGGRTAVTPVIEALLDDVSEAAYYMLCRTGMIDTVEYAYLDGNEALFVDSELGFDVDGIKMKVRLDFGAKTIDYRGLAKATGAA